MLFGLLPGAALVSVLFPLDAELEWAERIAFSVGISVALSLQATWFYSIAAERMSLPGLLVVLNVLALGAAGFALWRTRAELPPKPVRITITHASLVSIGLILLVAITCFLWLDYSDYDLDEVPVLDNAVGMILGNHAAVYRLAKGPAQVLLSAAFILFGYSVAEGYVRVPFALMTVAVALAFLGLSKRVLGQRGAWVASLCLALDGFSIGKARVVQFQTLVFPFVFLTFAAFLLSVRTVEPGARRRLQLTGAIFGGLGMFAHYTGALILPALAILWLWSERNSLRRRSTWLYAAALASVGALNGGLFYVLMLRQPELADKVGTYYVGYRLGSGPFNMLGHIILHIRFYESPPWILFVGLGVLALAMRIGGSMLRAQRSLGVLYVSALGASLGAVLLPDAFIVMGFDLAFLPFTILAICIALSVTVSLEARALSIWMLSALIVPAFWMQVPGNHYSLVLAPAIMLAVLGWRELMLPAVQRIPRRAWPITVAAASVMGMVLAVWGLSYVYEMFVAYTPEYGVLYPDKTPQPIALFAGDSPNVKYNIPHNNGWRVIAALYDAGILRGEFRTNELAGPPNWYVSQHWKPDQAQPRYYFFVQNQQVPALGSAPPASLAERYWVWGRITVTGVPHILIDQLRDGQPAPEPRTLAAEDFGEV
jgi:4-amino-4-deoxy-L-arabinose transferase-like glycosyltransferase